MEIPHQDLELILRKISNLEIVIIGGETAPQERAMELLDFSLESGVIHRLRWIDRVNHDAMVEVYGSTIASRGVILSTSKGESFGMALLEGILSGAPTVAPRNSAVPELTEESSGFQLYPEGDIDPRQTSASASSANPRSGSRRISI